MLSSQNYTADTRRMISEYLPISLKVGFLVEREWCEFYKHFVDRLEMVRCYINKRLSALRVSATAKDGYIILHHQSYGDVTVYIPGDYQMEFMDLLFTQIIPCEKSELTDHEYEIYKLVFERLNDKLSIRLPGELQVLSVIADLKNNP